MQRIRFRLLISTLVVVFSASLLPAGQAMAAQVTVLDANGAPLENAVILVEGVPQRSLPAAVVDQIDMQFLPRVLVVPRDTLVDFPNSDDVRHHVYSFSAAKRFELRLFKGSDAPPVLFDQSGAVILGCNIHDSMVGYVLVTDSPWYSHSDAAGSLPLDQLPPGNWPVSWWHPSLGDAPPESLGELDLYQLGSLNLAVQPQAEASEPVLSPLQQRFRKAGNNGRY